MLHYLPFIFMVVLGVMDEERLILKTFNDQTCLVERGSRMVQEMKCFLDEDIDHYFTLETRKRNVSLLLYHFETECLSGRNFTTITTELYGCTHIKDDVYWKITQVLDDTTDEGDEEPKVEHNLHVTIIPILGVIFVGLVMVLNSSILPFLKKLSPRIRHNNLGSVHQVDDHAPSLPSDNVASDEHTSNDDEEEYDEITRMTMMSAKNLLKTLKVLSIYLLNDKLNTFLFFLDIIEEVVISFELWDLVVLIQLAVIVLLYLTVLTFLATYYTKGSYSNPIEFSIRWSVYRKSFVFRMTRFCFFLCLCLVSLSSFTKQVALQASLSSTTGTGLNIMGGLGWVFRGITLFLCFWATFSVLFETTDVKMLCLAEDGSGRLILNKIGLSPLDLCADSIMKKMKSLLELVHVASDVEKIKVGLNIDDVHFRELKYLSDLYFSQTS